MLLKRDSSKSKRCESALHTRRTANKIYKTFQCAVVATAAANAHGERETPTTNWADKFLCEK